MNIYLLTANGKISYDEYDSFVVTAKTKKNAMSLTTHKSWNSHDGVTIKLIGKSKSKIEEIVCASFNAG